MRLFRRGAYVLALAFPLGGGAAKAEVNWEKVPNSKINLGEVVWSNVDNGKTQREIAKSNIKEDSVEKISQDKRTQENLDEIVESNIKEDSVEKISQDKKTEEDIVEITESSDKDDSVEKEAEAIRKNDNPVEITESNTKKDSIENDNEATLVLISEVVIKGLENHPDEDRLRYAAYDAMNIRPGSRVSRLQLKRDLNSIYATGWFSGLEIQPIDTPLGVQLSVNVQPNPIFTEVEIIPSNSLLTQSIIRDIFKTDFGKTLNLNVLKLRMNKLKDWYSKRGFSLARISGPNRITPKGKVQLKVQEGTISDVEVVFLDEEGNSIRENGKPVRGKTKRWVIDRELLSRPGLTFNRNDLESDIKRLYGLSLFSDIKVTLKPIVGEPGKITILLGITEQRTGSLTGGLGYSGAQGFFGSAGLQEKNLLGRSWSSDLNFTYGEYGALVTFSLADPWIKGNKYKKSFRTSLFLSRDVPQEFRSSEGGNIAGVSDYYQVPGSSETSKVYDIDYAHSGINAAAFSSVPAAKSSDSNTSWFDYEGDSVLLKRSGAKFSFSRPLNGGDPFKKSPWAVLWGMDFQKIRPIDYSSKDRPYGAVSANYTNNSASNKDVICIAFNCAKENTLFGVRGAMTYNKLDNPRNPTSGNYLSLGSEQYVSIGENSPTFNRAKASYSYFIPIKWLKLHKGCRPKSGEKASCPQTLAFQLKAGTVVGDLPPYEAFCLGGSRSIRGWSSCDLAVSRAFGEASAEYRVPIWRMISGNVFIDGGTDLNTQKNVPGNPGKLLGKQGSGFSIGSGLSFNTPVGPLRIEAASKDLEGDWRYNVGFGWKF
ncbi:Outer membrane protein/protective antigen OMA87 [Prochlorococcus marinus str. SS51]|nr:Outer membrane protein/protective antigen OMA87 [Prochlorococcus marinus str. LG]KGG24600.1 Outer membrane protein/protective antigen OMA87 [Prochlorococcus marinus str. SS35]KGG33493.1 Outer membrane protein/protective antigen OMA87 [Prochlorococcus marinus str. SS51]